ncbi:hypothetical protein [Mesorhizobium sp.]|uniref:hypothetical protein n=1 Tax=Mesorhizobium sp. TaxID=1871066 RepID=UPI000FE44200|nr:hypothetical protein [Mesorhizobium sp.]RWN90609.1 MAG: hypothetical protein EOS06_33455 [Mesorhizobium sp.]RWO39225.1 MAG: hypothetical protein EOS13_33940 [Mesorhizobium sp.]RWO75704.1 MAG: hypothetical protein EOS18_29110 [Mesorhizobium sp.]TIN23222.1 MAG: hypothetical protein E5Y19_28215 [Mesorhizobium sp.]TIN33618.1 MAG: hypothetical protein E5Y13_31935 [Mesorhizobium sp.]
MRYRTNNEGTGYRGKDHDQPIKPEAEHFEHCPICGQDFDMRDLGQVLHHAGAEHQPVPVDQ